MFLKQFTSEVKYLLARYNQEQERLSTLSERDFFFEQNSKCYTIIPNGIDNMRQDFNLSFSTYTILLKLLMLNNTNHRTSARSLGEVVGIDKNIVGSAIRDLKSKNIIQEEKFGQFKKFKVVIPLKYRSKFTSDKNAGTELKTFKGFTKFKVYANHIHLNNKVYAKHIQSNDNVYDKSIHIESQILQSEIKKSQSSETDSSFKMLLKKWKNEHQLRCVLSYIETNRLDILNPYGMLNSPNFTQKHFDEFYGKHLEIEREANRNKEKTNPIDIEAITNQALEIEGEDLLSDFDMLNISPEQKTELDQALAEMMLSLRNQVTNKEYSA